MRFDEKMQLSSIQRWRSSERIALSILEQQGFQIVETHKKIIINGTEVGEVDIVARDKEGNIYAIEVKAGKIDVTGIRQAYVNAMLLNMKPMIVCKGYADDAARELAQKLGIPVIQLSDVFLVEDEELEIVVREAVEEALSNFFELLLTTPLELREEQKRILIALASSTTLQETAERLGMPLETLLKFLNEFRSLGIIPRWAKKWSSIKRIAQILVAKLTVKSTIEEMKNSLTVIQEMLSDIRKFHHNLK
ncbi:MAG TPA: recombinase RecB, partial [Ignisphaera sp.]|nr:recombinase RecB [Ignisphaera sp.]